MTVKYAASIVLLTSVVIGANFLLAKAGAPQQVWFFCTVLDLCKEPVR